MRVSGQQLEALRDIQEALSRVRSICRQLGWEHPDTFRISSVDKMAHVDFELLGGGVYVNLKKEPIGNE